MAYNAVDNHSQVNLSQGYATNSPYGSGDPYYNSSTGYITPSNTAGKSRGMSKWIKFGIPVAVIVIAGAVVGGVLGSRRSSSSSSSSSSSGSGSAAASGAVSAKNGLGRFASATNSEWMLPVYPSTTNTAAFTSPTFNPSSSAAWPVDPFQPSSPSVTTVRTDRPRLIAPAYKWQNLPSRIAADPYLKGWNDTIFSNASDYSQLSLVAYILDGGPTGNGLLDAARQVKQRIKVYSYAYRMTNNTKWADLAWGEINNTGSNNANWGANNSTKWNPVHFLDTAEMCAAYAIAYDWLYDVLTDAQKQQMRNDVIQFGLNNGIDIYANNNMNIGWWTGASILGNWNCVCNNGLTMAALAILGDDTTGTAAKLLGYTVPNAKSVCAMAPTTDGTWPETMDYWYFGTTGYAEMVSSLITATGSDYGMLGANPGFNLTGYFHMYGQGATQLFAWGDTGPNKFTATANPMLFFGSQFNTPVYQLYQRDQWDAADPWSMFWYDPSVTGAFWDGLALDRYFDNNTDQWASMRSSWTDANALFVAVKGGTLQGHQTHNDLDVGDFVIDALGTRWAGELGDGNYLSTGYFTSDAQDAQRWLYYRKRTEGQNTLLVDGLNQNVLAAPTVSFGSTGESQGSSTVYTVPDGSGAYFVTDMSSAYFNSTSVKRGVRTVNKRRQVLVQDEITTSTSFQWRMHTNASVTIDSSGTSATLKRDGQTMTVQLLSPTSGASLTTQSAVRLSTDPPLPTGESDQPNDGITVLTVAFSSGGTYTIALLFNPQWSGMSSSAYTTPSITALDQWSKSNQS
ncbi:chondroitin AC/alginate lyase [Vararia minispora EC-137]|uniref:Chondroitin AC/alginate lyase n=1 Tax=Vararia minispora EC-137 TaxID=1314806 RepID=A0ACB8QIS1_9AGAM|nr:chondroitin AC/alginate lyase [Vararia minispora EC-137]